MRSPSCSRASRRPCREGLTARRIETFEEYAAANAVQWEAFGSSPEEIAEANEALRQRYAETVNVVHARLAGRRARLRRHGRRRPSTACCSTAARPAERARGRGAYRALIRARWDEAVALGTPALITQGGSMSRPILERLGFERVGEVHMLLDVFADG